MTDTTTNIQTENSASIIFTNAQIDTLQQQLKLYKSLSKRYGDSNIPKTTEVKQETVVETKPNENSTNNTSNSNNSSNGTSAVANKQVEVKQQIDDSTKKSSDTAPLSWQCFNSLLPTGPSIISNSAESLISSFSTVRTLLLSHL